jgi:hypothetical protein
MARARVTRYVAIFLIAAGVTYLSRAASVVSATARSEARISEAVPESPIVLFNRQTGARQPFPRVTGYGERVDVIEGDGSGGWYIGGDFQSVAGVPCRNFAHVFRTGRVDRRWCLNPRRIRAIVRTKTTLYIAGGPGYPFIGEYEPEVAAIDLATQRLTSWKPTCTGPPIDCTVIRADYIYSLDLERSVIYYASDRGFAALDASTGELTAWRPSYSFGYRGTPLGIVVFGSTVYLWGSHLNRVGGAKRCELAAVSAGSARVTRWNPCPNDGIGDLNLHGYRLFISGSFTRIAGVKRRGLVAFDAASGKVTSWRPQTPGGVETSVVYGRTVYAVGGLHRDPADRNGERQLGLLFGVDGQTGKRRGWHVRLSGWPSVLAVNARSVVLGGSGLRAATG